MKVSLMKSLALVSALSVVALSSMPAQAYVYRGKSKTCYRDAQGYKHCYYRNYNPYRHYYYYGPGKHGMKKACGYYHGYYQCKSYCPGGYC